MNSIVTAAQALAGLLRAAEDGDLPMPSSVDVTSGAAPAHHPAYRDLTHEPTGGIAILVRSLDDLVQWATYLDSSIDDSTLYAGNIHYRAVGWAGPVPVVATCVAAPAVTAVTA